MARDARSLPTGHREVTLMESRAYIGGLTAADKPERGSEKMPALLAGIEFTQVNKQ